VSLGVYQTPLLPPESGLNLNPGSYQSDEQGSQAGSRAFPGSFVQLELTFQLAGREASFLWINTVEWHLAEEALPVGQGC
jgi:hypothetical protein